jgi:hypothetical protein
MITTNDLAQTQNHQFIHKVIRPRFPNEDLLVVE